MRGSKATGSLYGCPAGVVNTPGPKNLRSFQAYLKDVIKEREPAWDLSLF